MRKKKPAITLFTLIFNTVIIVSVYAFQAGPEFRYSLSFSEADMHTYHVDFSVRGAERDTLDLNMPQWMPGYYQIMNYADDLKDISARDTDGEALPIIRTGGSSWQLSGTSGKDVVISYDIATHRRFVANSYADSAHAYILPTNTFLYPEGYLDEPAVVHIINRDGWDQIATGLDMLPGTTNQFYAPDYDILYDSPLLAGNLEVFPSFFVEGIEHRFMAYEPGDFESQPFMKDLKRIVQTAVDMFGEVPYESYTFIGLGKGLGGIEHLNNTTISFHGSSLATGESRKRVLAFIAHEYFHHFNVKRIRPFELGPFDYSRENRTNQLWISEGLTVYYEYLLLRRAGLISEKELLDFLAGDINAYENDNGKDDQSLREASFYTWEEGPFGTRGGAADRSISYYEKGCIVGLLLDFQIRSATQNEHSLDDVMRLLYRKYYKEMQRGFTEAEFQHACESIAGKKLSNLFEYVYTTKEIDYPAYLSLAGLQLEGPQDDPGRTSDGAEYSLTRKDFTDQLQREIYTTWQENKK